MLRRRRVLKQAAAAFAAALAAAALPAPALKAAPRPYRLDPAATSAGFIFTLNGVAQRGSIPITAARISIDAQDLTQSRADVTLAANQARTGISFATEALRSPQVLDAAHFPNIRYVTLRVQLGPGGRLSGGARLHGLLTLRGVTRPLSLAAALYRPPGSAPTDLALLDIRLSGALSRAAFGASGYPDLVGDRVGLDIRARLLAAG
ncbi:YceI family protein [Cribrihabitans neustonicus]|uniref:YceI family protein n=1 Tax=Cribrihabitans neustonicus TaxID=1429085 RepID=UPI003B5A89EF